MIVKMALAFPFFKEMHDCGRGHIRNKFVPGAAGFEADNRHRSSELP